MQQEMQASVAVWYACRTRNPASSHSIPALAIGWICSLSPQVQILGQLVSSCQLFLELDYSYFFNLSSGGSVNQLDKSVHLPPRSPLFFNNSIFILLKQVKCSAILYHYRNVTQPHPQVFSVNGLIIWQFAPRLTSSVHTSQTSSKFGRQQLVMMDYAWNFSQSEMAKYFE